MNDFTTSCFIRKNNPELRKKLEDLGYNIINSDYKTINGKHIDTGKAIITYEGDNKTYAVVNKIDMVVKHGRIDCGEDENLFFAIATLCHDNSKYYLLPCDKSFKIFRKSSINELIEDYNNINNNK